MKHNCAVFAVSLFCIVGIFAVSINKIVPTSMIIATKHTAPTLILDAGHGGEDGGTSSAGGIKESDLNLAIVMKLDALLAFCGVNSVLTRSEDISLHSDGCQTIREKKVSDLKNRVVLVNSIENALLISVHQNHFTDPIYKGSQVFYNTGDISRQWGEHTQEILRQTLNNANKRKAKLLTDSVYLFKHISCPAILVECGFLSNGEEASLLMADSYQRKIAVALTGASLHQLQTLQGFSGGDRIGKS